MTETFSALALALCLSLGEEAPAPSGESPANPPVVETPAVPPDDAGIEEALSPTKPIPGIRRLDRKSRAKVLAALAAFVILWLALVVFIWLGARFTRRYMRGSPRPSIANLDDDDWARKRLVPEGEEEDS